MIRYLLLFLVFGCSSATTVDPNEKLEEFQKQDANCSKAGGAMVVKRTGTRIRRAIRPHEVATASCQKVP